MNYTKIQNVLAGDSKFAALASNRDITVQVRGGECNYSSLTVRIAQEMETRGIPDAGWQKTLILALAMKLSKDHIPLPLSVMSAPPRPPPPPLKLIPVRKKPVVVVAPPPPPAPVPAPDPVVMEKVERVTVKPAPNPAVTASPVKQQASQQNTKLEEFMDRGDLIRYQSAIASCQLMAALCQLAERDTWPGHEDRKKLINSLLDSYEQMAKDHVNLSVKEIIIRAKTEDEKRR